MAITGSKHFDARLGSSRESAGSLRSMRGGRYLYALGGGLLTAFGLKRSGFGGAVIAGTGMFLVARGLLTKDSKRKGKGGLARQHSDHLRIDRSITILKSKEELANQLSRPQSFVSLFSHVRAIWDLGDGQFHCEVVGPGGAIIERDITVGIDDQGHRISWRTQEGEPACYSGQIVLIDAPGDRGVEVHVTVRYEVMPGDAEPRFLGGKARDLGELLADDLRRFKQLEECGETPSTSGQPRGRRRVGWLGETSFRQLSTEELVLSSRSEAMR